MSADSTARGNQPGEEFQINSKKYPIPRVRHHSNPQVYLPAHQAQKDLEWYPPVIDTVDWPMIYKNGLPPSVLDIGCGRGGFLLNHAVELPHANILGLEVRKLLVDWANAVIKGEDILNAHVFWYSLANGLGWIDPESVDYAVYLFPDPWPKRRHKKRVAFTEDFLRNLHRVLKPGGRLYLASDRQDVMEQQYALIEESTFFRVVEQISVPLAPNNWPFTFKTDQQLFSERKGIPYAYSLVERVDAPSTVNS